MSLCTTMYNCLYVISKRGKKGSNILVAVCSLI
jgi:hypothetical protein